MIINIHTGPLWYRIQITQLVLLQRLLPQPTVYRLVLSRTRHVLLLWWLLRLILFLPLHCLLRLGHYWVLHKCAVVCRARVVCVHVRLWSLFGLERLVWCELWLLFLLCDYSGDHVRPWPWCFVAVVLACVDEICLVWYDSFGLIGWLWPFHRQVVFIGRRRPCLFGLSLHIIDVSFSVGVLGLMGVFRGPDGLEIGLVWIRIK